MFLASFSEFCYDNNSSVCGFNIKVFQDRLKSEIPNIIIPIQRREEVTTSFDFDNHGTNNESIDKYRTLDFIEFCYKNIQEAIQNDYHEYFKHHHFNFKESTILKNDFKNKINQIFERNGIVFFINDEGEINKTLPKAIEPLINQIYHTDDSRLNELVQLANGKFILPKIEDRIYALEKIWDAFERTKTYYVEKNKKESVTELIELVSNGNNEFINLINDEANSLTAIGNKYQIRHFETNKIEITDNKHVDYLFYRMISLIHLFSSELE